MSSNEFIEYLNDFNDSNISNTCKKKLKSLQKLFKNVGDEDTFQIIEIIALYYDSMMIKANNDALEMSQLNEMLEGNEFKSFEEYVHGLADAINAKYSENTNKEIPNQIDWILRPTLTMSISDTEISINKSFMNYIKEISESLEPRHIQMANPISPYSHIDTDEDDENIRCVMGTMNGDIALSLMSGVTNIHKFEFIEMNDGTGSMNSYDVKHFHAKTKHSFSGLYIFELNEELKSLIGKPFKPINVKLYE